MYNQNVPSTNFSSWIYTYPYHTKTTAVMGIQLILIHTKYIFKSIIGPKKKLFLVYLELSTLRFFLLSLFLLKFFTILFLSKKIVFLCISFLYFELKQRRILNFLRRFGIKIFSETRKI